MRAREALCAVTFALSRMDPSVTEESLRLRRLQATSPEEEGDGPRERRKEADREPVSIALFSPAARRRQIWIIYFIGFMVYYSSTTLTMHMS